MGPSNLHYKQMYVLNDRDNKYTRDDELLKQAVILEILGDFSLLAIWLHCRLDKSRASTEQLLNEIWRSCILDNHKKGIDSLLIKTSLP